MGRGAWRATVHRLSKSRTRLRNFHFIFHISKASILEGTLAFLPTATYVKNTMALASGHTYN